MPSIRLSDLIFSLPQKVVLPAADPLVSGIALDSRKIQPGFLFVACPGATTDGHRFIPDAIRRGASAVVGSQPISGLAVPYIQVTDSRRALAYLAAGLHGFPARRMTMLGVTGTDGKTTTSNLIFHILQAAGLRAGMISTVNAVIGDEILDTGFHVTTPDAPDIQNYLEKMVSAGLSHAVIETTSHGLEQDRVAACDFDIGIVTNITHEHINDHGSLDAYRAAKARLFTSLEHTQAKSFHPPRAAVLNMDDWSYDYLLPQTKVPVVSYGLHENAAVIAADIQVRQDGLEFQVRGRTLGGGEFTFPVQTWLEGWYNVYNCVAAIAATVSVLGIDPAVAQSGIAALKGVPGRMQRIDLGQDFTAIVDFAHTPNALKEALLAVRKLTQGKVIAVFGSAGLRDQQKRFMMSETSAELADLTVLTAEDPRTESLTVILDEMAQGAVRRGGVEGKTFWRVPDRGNAIRFALTLARPGDLVISCGKGHEQSMCFGTVEYPWDDRTAMRAALSGHLGIPGPSMPYLPTQEQQ
ncbi:MAG: UDP-N-acetylmuramoyl-L-alanyl-D-glutamate--2,6-diaminopimelate ligase [Anaerolineales bacterium]|nr:UDP-N-acetylmuramoyl-L-alanyl-D-glutamate--2,6-diaminopimelate ligase [Anaerolineales bacterium]